jgi:hypothetical protein
MPSYSMGRGAWARGREEVGVVVANHGVFGGLAHPAAHWAMFRVCVSSFIPRSHPIFATTPIVACVLTACGASHIACT